MARFRRSGVVVLLTLLQLCRQTHFHAWDTIYGEDGRIYATDALGRGWATSIFRGYANYVQVVPRLIALPIRLLPPGAWAIWFATVGSLVTALLAVYVLVASKDHISSPELRLGLAALTALSPVMWFEISANTVNLGWPLLYAAFWASVQTTTTRQSVVVRCVVLAAAALTTPLAVFVLPVAAVMTWRRRSDRRSLLIAVVFVFALGVQGVADRYARPGVRASSSSVVDFVRVYVVRVLGTVLVGERKLAAFWIHLHDAFALGICLAFAAIAILLYVMSRGRSVPLVVPVLAAVSSLLLFFGPLAIRGSSMMRLSATYQYSGSRYVYVPALLVVTALVCVIDASKRTLLRHVAAAQIAVVIVTSFGLTNDHRVEVAPWPATLAAARARCAHLADSAAVHLSVEPRGWAITTRCGSIR